MIPAGAIQARRANRLSTVLVWLFLTGCAAGTVRQSLGQQIALSRSAPASATPDADTGTDVPSRSSDPQLIPRNARYAIQREDVLILTFPLTPDLNQTVTVQADGYISLENASSLYIQGLTVPELVVALKKAYAGTLHNPIISVDLKDFQKPFFTVSGQVGKPGKYELRSDLTVAEAIAVGGGLTPTAKTQILLYHKTPNNLFQVEKFNLKDVLNGRKINEDPIIRPGDMIYVPDKFIANFRKYVPYALDGGTYLTPNPL